LKVYQRKKIISFCSTIKTRFRNRKLHPIFSPRPYSCDPCFLNFLITLSIVINNQGRRTQISLNGYSVRPRSLRGRDEPLDVGNYPRYIQNIGFPLDGLNFITGHSCSNNKRGKPKKLFVMIWHLPWEATPLFICNTKSTFYIPSLILEVLELNMECRPLLFSFVFI
jgi:hypothetical protein